MSPTAVPHPQRTHKHEVIRVWETDARIYGVPFALLFLRRNFKYLTVILQRTYHNLTVMLLDSDKSLAASLALASESDSHGLQHCPLVVPPHPRVV